jgi:hypothetical protein
MDMAVPFIFSPTVGTDVTLALAAPAMLGFAVTVTDRRPVWVRHASAVVFVLVVTGVISAFWVPAASVYASGLAFVVAVATAGWLLLLEPFRPALVAWAGRVAEILGVATRVAVIGLRFALLAGAGAAVVGVVLLADGTLRIGCPRSPRGDPPLDRAVHRILGRGGDVKDLAWSTNDGALQRRPLPEVTFCPSAVHPCVRGARDSTTLRLAMIVKHDRGMGGDDYYDFIFSAVSGPPALRRLRFIYRKSGGGAATFGLAVGQVESGPELRGDHTIGTPDGFDGSSLATTILNKSTDEQGWHKWGRAGVVLRRVETDFLDERCDGPAI